MKIENKLENNRIKTSDIIKAFSYKIVMKIHFFRGTL